MSYNIVKVVPPHFDKGDAPGTTGTKVLNEDGTEIHGITAIDIKMVSDDIVRMTISLFGSFDELSGTPTFVMRDPMSGMIRVVKSVKWAEGDETLFEE
jgi:hypothetical protein